MKPRLLDLFCGAGGAARGYQLAGFHVTGVDVNPQPRYAGDVFHQADAMTFPLDGFDAIHASPPCQDHSSLARIAGTHGTGWMLDATVSRLRAAGVPYVVENVEGADFPAGFRIRLCGSSFGLDVRRHRWFATDVAMVAPPCAHGLQRPRFRSLDRRQQTLATVVGVHGHLNYPGEGELRSRAMGIDWMTQPELTQAIPPIYTQFIGEWLLEHVAVAA